MTSLYRQLGTGCERVFRMVLQDALGLSADEAAWSYQVPAARGKGKRTLKLDGRIPIGSVKDEERKKEVARWVKMAAKAVKVDKVAARGLLGPVFEVRQGYKSADAKRQNADIGNAANAYANRYLPVNLLLSTQGYRALMLFSRDWARPLGPCPWGRI